MIYILRINETWAGVYFQAILALLIFGIGFPALLHQRVVGDDLRKIVDRRYVKYKLITSFSIFLSTISLSILAWFLHPCNACEPALEYSGIGAKTFAKIERFIVNPTVNNFITVNAVFTFLVVSSVFLWVYQDNYRRDAIIKQISKELQKKLKNRKNLDESLLEDLRNLGEYGKPGSEKSQVLESLSNITDSIMLHPNYEGNQLEDVIYCTEAVLASGCQIENWKKGVAIFRKMLVGSTPNSNCMKDGKPNADMSLKSDQYAVLRALERLGSCTATSFENDEALLVVLDCVELAMTAHSSDGFPFYQALAHIGIAALHQHRYTSATKVLSQFLLIRQSVSNEKSDNIFCGLLAHFWTSGSAANYRSRSTIRMISDSPTEIDKKIRAAWNYYYNNTDFVTADFLEKMATDMDLKSPNPDKPT